MILTKVATCISHIIKETLLMGLHIFLIDPVESIVDLLGFGSEADDTNEEDNDRFLTYPNSSLSCVGIDSGARTPVGLRMGRGLNLDPTTISIPRAHVGLRMGRGLNLDQTSISAPRAHVGLRMGRGLNPDLTIMSAPRAPVTSSVSASPHPSTASISAQIRESTVVANQTAAESRNNCCQANLTNQKCSECKEIFQSQNQSHSQQRSQFQTPSQSTLSIPNIKIGTTPRFAGIQGRRAEGLYLNPNTSELRCQRESVQCLDSDSKIRDNTTLSWFWGLGSSDRVQNLLWLVVYLLLFLFLLLHLVFIVYHHYTIQNIRSSNNFSQDHSESTSPTPNPNSHESKDFNFNDFQDAGAGYSGETMTSEKCDDDDNKEETGAAGDFTINNKSPKTTTTIFKDTNEKRVVKKCGNCGCSHRKFDTNHNFVHKPIDIESQRCQYLA